MKNNGNTEENNYRKYDLFYRIARPVLGGAAAGLLHFHGEALPETEEPVFLLCNHNTDLDFLLLASLSRKPLDFVATESMLRMGPLARTAAKHLHPILHDKGSLGIATVRSIINRLKENRNVVLFPEGNRSFDGRTCTIPPSTGKFVRMTGAALVLYRLSGGYFTSPRWGKGLRPGKMEGHVTGVYSPQELRKMTPEQVQNLIEDGLWEDAYRTQKEAPVRYRSRRGAEFLESVLFWCPRCGGIGTQRSHGNGLSCSCGYSMRYSRYGYLEAPAGKRFSVTRLLSLQQKYLKEMIGKAENIRLWSDQVLCRRIDAAHRILQEEEITLSADGKRLYLGDQALGAEEISDISIVQRNRLGIHMKSGTDHFELTGEPYFNALKYRMWKETAM